MGVLLDLGLASDLVSTEELATERQAADVAYEQLPTMEMTGWLTPDEGILSRIKTLAKNIKTNSQILVSIGIGGSYLGAKAVIEALGGDGVEVVFAGNSLSSKELQKALDAVAGKDFAVCVISKSGGTLEPALAFRIFRKALVEKYGADEANRRIVAITDANKGSLHDLAVQKGWEMLSVPDDVGGRFSVLTVAQLLTIATKGVDVEQLLAGAKQAATDEQCLENAKKYAALRHLLYKKSKKIEILSSFEPSLQYFAEWWKQLFGESEGKNQQGIFPASVSFTTDLHSLGQFIQDGERDLFETVLRVEKSAMEIAIPLDDENGDGLNYLAGKNLSLVNEMALIGTKQAHADGGVPVIEITVPEITAFHLGQLIFFFELSCALSAMLFGVNPFDQPGVEAYKNNMFALLGKPEK
ncbi:MAG: glucose-6-phosphate isomerase [Candidatus Nomurabacteria bacterium]|jgi:glucose-6-phosphate isomerase|nr:glucose-6-phosphate isomerase [Candidatus Nomurabacteria bacterium]